MNKKSKRLMKKSNKKGMGWFNGSHPHNDDDLELTKGGYVNTDAGNVPIGIAAFNNSANASSNSSMSVAEALFDLNNKELDEKISYPMNQNTWVFKGQTFLDGRPYVYERQGIYTTASSQRQAVNNIIYKLCDGDKQKIYRMDIDETGLELIGNMSKGIKKEREKDDFSDRQLSMFDMMNEEQENKKMIKIIKEDRDWSIDKDRNAFKLVTNGNVKFFSKQTQSIFDELLGLVNKYAEKEYFYVMSDYNGHVDEDTETIAEISGAALGEVLFWFRIGVLDNPIDSDNFTVEFARLNDLYFWRSLRDEAKEIVEKYGWKFIE